MRKRWTDRWRTRTDLAKRPGAEPWWVKLFTDVGRPIAVVLVMALCAPGEQHLARLAGWSGKLSWAMAGLLVAYAGIAAVVATKRPPGGVGKVSAIFGAVLALLLAATAQPISHLFVTGWLSAEPRPPIWLVVTVSCVPPLVLGHLLHLAASPSDVSAPPDRLTLTRDGADTASDVRAPYLDAPDGHASLPQGVADGNDVPASLGWDVRDTLSGSTGEVSGDAMHWGPDTPPDGYAEPDTQDDGTYPVPPEPEEQDARTDTVVKLSGRRGSLTSVVLDILTDYPDMSDDHVKENVLALRPEAKADSIRKAIARARDKIEASA